MQLYPELSYEELDALFYLFGIGGKARAEMYDRSIISSLITRTIHIGPNGMVFESDDKGATTYEYSSLLPGFHHDGRQSPKHRLSKL